jgi:hypothetical protein
MKTYGGVDVWIHISLTSALFACEWSASLPGGFIPRRAPGTHYIGGLADLRAGLDNVKEKKFLNLLGLELQPSLIQPVASRCTDCVTAASSIIYKKYGTLVGLTPLCVFNIMLDSCGRNTY